jgi:hypothetical protein
LPSYPGDGGLIESEVAEGSEKIDDGIVLTVPLKVDVRVTVIGFPSSSIM